MADGRRANGKRQRSTKLERYAALEVLKGIWQKAYDEKRVELGYPPDHKREMESVFNALSDYRRKVREKPTENAEMFHKVMSCTLKRIDAHTILIERKAATLSGRTNAVLSVANRFPELGLKKPHENASHDLSEILVEFKQKSIDTDCTADDTTL